MKTITRLLLSAIALGGAMSVQSCVDDPNQKEQIPEPNFPETVIEKEIVEGEETTEFSIEPNQAWKVELQGEGAGSIFWIDDNGVPEPSISGSVAEKEEFSVVFNTEKEFDVNRVCKVNLSMGGKSKVIAILTRTAEQRTLTFKVAGINPENTAFTEDYTDQMSTELVAFAGGLEYSRPVQILANYDWVLALPDWCEAYKDGELVEGAVQGEKTKLVELTLKAKMTKDIVAGAEGVIKVTDNAVSDKFSEVKVNFPDITGRIELTEANSTEFNEKGEVKMGAIAGFQAQPAIAYVLSVEDVVFKALPWKGEHYGIDFADWVTFETGWNAEGPALQNYDLSISVHPYEGEGERYADVLVLPKTMDSTDINTYLLEDGSALKEEYEPYLLNRFVQVGKMGEFLTPVSTPEAMAEVKASLVANPDSWLAGTFETKQIFELTYGMEWSCDEAHLNTAKPIDHYEVYDFDVNLIPEAEMADFWCTLWIDGESKSEIVVNMTPDACPTPDKMAFIALYSTPDATIPDAVIQASYNADAPVNPGADGITISMGSGSISKLGEVDDWYWTLNNEYSVTEVYEVVTADFSLSLHTAQEFWNILLVKAEPPFADLTDGSFSVESMGDALVYVGESVAQRSDCVLVFQDQNGMNFAAVHFVYDPDYSPEGGQSLPFSFAYPDAVGEATLAPYAGNMDEITGNFYGVKPENVYQLTYESEWGNTAMLNTPGQPAFLFGFNCPEGQEETYWLQSEWDPMSSTLSVSMSEIGQTDYLVWKAADGYTFEYILVCTRTK